MIPAAPPALVAALLASIDAPAHAWQVTARVVAERREQIVTPGAGEGDPPVISTRITHDVTVSLMTLRVAFPPRTEIALQVTYCATLGAGGLESASLFVQGAQFAVAGGALHARVMALADAWIAGQAADIAAALAAALAPPAEAS